ncbi:MAG: hypothetical protein ABI867_27490 [Kofleriaceae bacterium]
MRSIVMLALLLGGCTLYEYNADDDVNPPGVDGGGSGPVGRSFFVSRISDGPRSPGCPLFSEESLSHNVQVNSLTSVVIDKSMSATNIQVRTGPARENIDPPNLVFTVNEFWEASEGTANPQITYRLFVASDQFTGTIDTFFQFSSPPTGTVSCNYTWTTSGFSG